MTTDNIFITFLALSLSSIMLALVIGTAGFDRLRFLRALANLTSSRRAMQYAHLDRLTRIADEARKAREQGLKFVPPSAL